VLCHLYLDGHIGDWTSSFDLLHDSEVGARGDHEADAKENKLAMSLIIIQ